MLRLVHEIEQIAPAYLRKLNECFLDWGDRAKFDWCFRRTAGGPAADLFVAEQDGLVAGSATTYRLIQRLGQEPELVGCMTASWTVRSARGRGLFQQAIALSRQRAREQGCRLLIAFAAAGKASRPGLLAAGAHAIEGAFLTSSDAATGKSSGRLRIGSPRDTYAAFAERSLPPNVTRFVYGPQQWREQMIDRPGLVEVWELSGATAIIERHGEIDRLLDVSAGPGSAFIEAVLGASEVSHAQGRRLSLFSLDQPVITTLTERGFAVSRAWLYLLRTDDDDPAELPGMWWIANGDRM